MLYGVDKGLFGTIKTNLVNIIMCVMDRYPRTKDKIVVLLKNDHVINQTACNILVKEDMVFSQIRGELNTSKNI